MSFPPEVQAMARRYAAEQDARAAAPAPAPAAPKRSPYTGTGAKRGMSRNEQRFAEHLHELGLAGRVSGWQYELLRVALPAKRSTAVLDFVVRASGAWGFEGLVVVEVKPRGKDGRPYFGPKGRLRIKLVAEQLAGLEVPVLVAWPCAGGWTVERIEARS